MSKRRPGYYRVRKQNTWYFAAWSDLAWHVMADETEIIFDSYWDEIIEAPISPSPVEVTDLNPYSPTANWVHSGNLATPKMSSKSDKKLDKPVEVTDEEIDVAIHKYFDEKYPLGGSDMDHIATMLQRSAILDSIQWMRELLTKKA